MAFIRQVEEEPETVVQTETEVEKMFRDGMPDLIKAVLNESSDIFRKDLPSGLPLICMGHEFKIELEDETPPVHRPIYKLSPLELEEAKKQIDYMLEHGYIRSRDLLMEHPSRLHQRRMAVYSFVSTTAG